MNHSNSRRAFLRRAAAVVLAAALLLAGCAAAEEPAPQQNSAVGFYFDTVITLSAYCDQELLDEALARCEYYENTLSKTVEGSDVWNINHAGGQPVTVSDDTIALLETALRASELSDGAFDVTIAPVTALWDFTSGEAVLPDDADIQAALPLVDYTQIKVEGNTVTLPAGMMIDLGGIAKGYIADELAAFLREQGVTSADLNLGGNVITIGRKPDGTAWRIGVQNPHGSRDESILILNLVDATVVTSGNYERYFELDGVRYHHILDPKTGYPVSNGLASVSIITQSSMYADALSTACYVLGLEEGMALIEELEDVEAIFITEDLEVHYSSGVVVNDSIN